MEGQREDLQNLSSSVVAILGKSDQCAILWSIWESLPRVPNLTWVLFSGHFEKFDMGPIWW